MKRLEKQLASKANFSTFLQLNFLNLRLQLCERPHSYKNCEQDQVLGNLDRVRRRKLFLETIIHKIFETNSSFHRK